MQELITENVDLVEVVAVDEDGDIVGKVLHPNGTRDFPNGGAIRVRNNATTNGKYRWRLGANGVWNSKTILPGHTDGYNAGNTDFYLKNIGTVDLDVTP
jgi:hypothetical protein